MFKKIHSGHTGIEKSKQRACNIMFWPGMSKGIEDIMGHCPIYQERRPSNTKEPMIPHRIPDRPLQVVGTEIFTWNGENYLVTVDYYYYYYSQFFELDRLLSTTAAAAVIRKLKGAFTRHGIAETVISDNGSKHAPAEFESFTKTWEFKHITSSPYYPQSNGLAEKTVQTAKALTDKAHVDKKDPYLCLLEYRNTSVWTILSHLHSCQ